MKVTLKYFSKGIACWHLDCSFEDDEGYVAWFYTKPTKTQIRKFKRLARTLWLYD